MSSSEAKEVHIGRPGSSARRGLRSRWAYYRRVFAAYVLGGNSHLTFWHGTPEMNPEAPVDRLGQYYMPFAGKAAYPGPFDAQGVPLLNYRGSIGRQYNPIAIAQYGLGNGNLYCQTGSDEAYRKFLLSADWLTDRLEPNPWGVPVWNHNFDFEYRDVLIAPWYSGLAQGQGLSLLVRAYRETSNKKYLDAAHQAFVAFLSPFDEGGVTWEWPDGDIWFEEYIVHPPTHILNGSIWALWGVYDYMLATEERQAYALFKRGVDTLARRLHRYEWGHWSLYDLPGTRTKNVASRFYHRLHVVQLRATERLAANPVLGSYADQWNGYLQNRWYCRRALMHKGLFKLLHY